MKWLKLTLVGLLAVAALLLTLLWWQQDRVAEQLLTRALPQLKYKDLRIDSTQGQLFLHGVDWQQPGLAVHGGDLTVKVDPSALIQQRLTIEQVLLVDGQIILTPAMLDTAAPAETTILPHQVALRHGTLTLHAPWAEGMAPMTLNVDAYQQPNGWSLQAALPLGGGQVRVAAVITAMDRYGTPHRSVPPDDPIGGAKVHGSIKAKAVALPQLLQQLPLPSPVAFNKGIVSATLDWTLPLAQPAAARVQGHIQLKNVELLDPLQHRRQSFPEVDAKVNWNGVTEQLTLSTLLLKQPHLRWNQPLLLAEEGAKNKKPSVALTKHDGAMDLKWKVDRLRVDDGQVSLALITPVGRMQLPIRISRATAQGLDSGQWRNAHAHIATVVADGTLALDWQRQKLRLEMDSLQFRALEPLALSVIGHRTLLGTMHASLQGTVKDALDLHGDFTFHNLAISPRIPVSRVNTSIPYALGLRALTDDAGTTRFPLTIGGSWQHPKLDPAAAISLAKQHPFRGGMDGDIRWQTVDFLVSKDQLTPTGYKQLAQLRDMLTDTAASRIELRGCVDPVTTLSPVQRQHLAAARSSQLKKLLNTGKTAKVIVKIVYPTLTDPSPDIDGNRDRVEIAIYPPKMK